MEWNRNYCLILTNRDLLFGMASKDREKAPKMYRDSVEKAIGQELENPLHNLYGGVILGDQGSVKQALNRLKDGIVQRREVLSS